MVEPINIYLAVYKIYSKRRLGIKLIIEKKASFDFEDRKLWKIKFYSLRYLNKSILAYGGVAFSESITALKLIIDYRM